MCRLFENLCYQFSFGKTCKEVMDPLILGYDAYEYDDKTFCAVYKETGNRCTTTAERKKRWNLKEKNCLKCQTAIMAEINLQKKLLQEEQDKLALADVEVARANAKIERIEGNLDKVNENREVDFELKHGHRRNKLPEPESTRINTPSSKGYMIPRVTPSGSGSGSRSKYGKPKQPAWRY